MDWEGEVSFLFLSFPSSLHVPCEVVHGGVQPETSNVGCSGIIMVVASFYVGSILYTRTLLRMGGLDLRWLIYFMSSI